MVFSSSLFLFGFLPLFLIIYYLIDFRFKNSFLLIASVFFYAWGAPSFVAIALISVVADFFLIHLMSKYEKRYQHYFLAVSVIFNLIILGYFKYFNFFIDNINFFLHVNNTNLISWVNIALPAGISFFTFKKISYAVDVYRGTHKPMDNLINYGLFIFLFPELIAGPIVRFNEIGYQIEDRRKQENIDNILLGFYRFIIGLSKKTLIANLIAKQVDEIFNLPNVELNTGLAWIGIIGYSIQIYFDFSGYSDMAIGLARMIGFKFPENFDNPYNSQNITEFWRRWHITLGRWMKDYLYIPLGGNKGSISRMYFNLFFVFIMSGFWHGASWNFILWGAFHGLFLIGDRLFLISFLNKIGRLPSVIITYIIVLTGWVLFRTETISSAINYLHKMYSIDTSISYFHLSNSTLAALILGLFFSFFCLTTVGLKVQNFIFNETYNSKTMVFGSIFCIIFLVICSSFIISAGFNPFIYYRF